MSLMASAAPSTALPQVSVHVLPNQVQLGQPFEVEVILEHPKDRRYDLKPVAGGDDFDVLQTSRSRSDDAAGAHTNFKIRLSAFRLGALKTPAMIFEVWDGARQKDLEVPGTDVEIVSSLPPQADPKPAELKDVTPPMEVTVRTYRLLYALGAALLLVAAFLALRKWLKRPKPWVAPPWAPPLPLHVRVKAALDALREEQLPTQGKAKEYYFRLSEIVRGYLGERYDFEALESTSPELIDRLLQLHTPGLPIPELKDFVFESDFVRYANAPADAISCKRAIELAYRIVDVTTNEPSHASQS
jgi:hypothetical protein